MPFQQSQYQDEDPSWIIKNESKRRSYTNEFYPPLPLYSPLLQLPLHHQHQSGTSSSSAQEGNDDDNDDDDDSVETLKSQIQRRREERKTKLQELKIRRLAQRYLSSPTAVSNYNNAVLDGDSDNNRSYKSAQDAIMYHSESNARHERNVSSSSGISSISDNETDSDEMVIIGRRRHISDDDANEDVVVAAHRHGRISHEHYYQDDNCDVIAEDLHISTRDLYESYDTLADGGLMDYYYHSSISYDGDNVQICHTCDEEKSMDNNMLCIDSSNDKTSQDTPSRSPLSRQSSSQDTRHSDYSTPPTTTTRYENSIDYIGCTSQINTYASSYQDDDDTDDKCCDAQGRCIYHPHVQLLRKRRVGGWKVGKWKTIRMDCTECRFEEVQRLRLQNKLVRAKQQLRLQPKVVSFCCDDESGATEITVVDYDTPRRILREPTYEIPSHQARYYTDTCWN